MNGRSKLVGLLVTVVCLALAVRNVDLAAVGVELAAADYRYLLPAAACTLSGYGLRTLRWQFILRPVRRLAWRGLFDILMLGFAANNILPARVGEIVRAYSLGRHAGISATLGLATIVVERVFDGLTLLLLMSLALQVAPVIADSDRLQVVEVVSVVIFVTALAVLVALLALRERALGVLDRVVRPLPGALARRIGGMGRSFIRGLECLRDRVAVARIAATSLLVWGAEAASYFFVTQSFGLGLAPRDHLAAVLFLLVFVNLGIMLPSGPGYIGTFQFFARLALAAFAVSAERAVGLAIVAHAMQYVLVTGIGLLVLWRAQVSLAGLLAPPPAEPAIKA